jgi:hypothetical protein
LNDAPPVPVEPIENDAAQEPPPPPVNPVVEALLDPADVNEEPPPPPRAVATVDPDVTASVDETPLPPGFGQVLVAAPPEPTVMV